MRRKLAKARGIVIYEWDWKSDEEYQEVYELMLASEMVRGVMDNAGWQTRELHRRINRADLTGRTGTREE